MRQIDLSDKLKERFVELLKNCGAALRPNEAAERVHLSGFDASTGAFFDLDRLWHDSDCLGELVKIVREAAKRLDKEAKFDTIVPLVSAVGSFGPTPWAGILAHEMNKSLVVLDEVEFGDLGVYPLTTSYGDLFTGKHVLLLKDVIVHATSVKRAARLVRDQGGEVVALLVLVDRKPPRRRYDFTDLADAWYAVLLEPGSQEER
ncbi:MAG TPA: hypothetical protein EYH31_02390 [Anaerolineae bacterium]|nr:hypothetical protein [Anaerolineae bacterium]